jgi:hypothetical protein
MRFAAAHESGDGPEPKCSLTAATSAVGGRPDEKSRLPRPPLLTHMRRSTRASPLSVYARSRYDDVPTSCAFEAIK